MSGGFNDLIYNASRHLSQDQVTRHKVNLLTKMMHEWDFSVSAMSGDMDQKRGGVPMREHDLSSAQHKKIISMR